MRLMLKVVNIVLFMLLSFSVVGQKSSDGEIFFNSGRYDKALEVFQGLLSRKPTDLMLNYKAGRCALELQQYSLAITYFERTAAKNFLKSKFYLGEAYYSSCEFVKAASVLTQYRSQLTDSVLILEGDRALQRATLAAGMLERIEDVAIVDSVQVALSDVFSWFKIRKDVGSFVNLNSYLPLEDSTIGFLAGRGDRLLFSKQVGGHSDIYIAYRLLDSWGEPQLLSGQINTDRNELYPYMMSDGVTLYFGSQSHDNLGGYDIFFSRFSSQLNDYLPPQNVGMPFNSIYNDYMMVVDDLSGIGWWVTDRFADSGKVVIYTFLPNEEKVIYRDLPEGEVLDYALLKRYRRGVVESDALPYVIDLGSTTSDQREFTFVLSDSLEYHKLSDFQSLDARSAYERYLMQEDSLDQVAVKLDELRMRLQRSAPVEERVVLQAQLTEMERLQMEYGVRLRRLYQEALLLEVRYIESHKP